MHCQLDYVFLLPPSRPFVHANGLGLPKKAHAARRGILLNGWTRMFCESLSRSVAADSIAPGTSEGQMLERLLAAYEIRREKQRCLNRTA